MKSLKTVTSGAVYAAITVSSRKARGAYARCVRIGRELSTASYMEK